MDRYLIIVARDRPNLCQHLSERHAADVQVIVDRRRAPRPTTRAAGLWHTSLAQDGYMVAVARTTSPGGLDRAAVTTA